MARFAVIQHNTVMNIIEAESKEIAESVTSLECVEITEENLLQINDLYTP
jgi:hypothetical protein